MNFATFLDIAVAVSGAGLLAFVAVVSVKTLRDEKRADRTAMMRHLERVCGDKEGL